MPLWKIDEKVKREGGHDDSYMADRHDAPGWVCTLYREGFDEVPPRTMQIKLSRKGIERGDAEAMAVMILNRLQAAELGLVCA